MIYIDIYIYIITTPILYDKLTNQDTSGPFEVWEAHPDFFEPGRVQEDWLPDMKPYDSAFL